MGNLFKNILESAGKGLVVSVLGVLALVGFIVPLVYVFSGNISWAWLILTVPVSIALFAGAFGALK